MSATNFFSVLTTTAIVASSSGTGYHTFGFWASQVTLENVGSIRIWAAFDACSTAASCSDVLVAACDQHHLKTLNFTDWRPVHRVTIYATSTVAGDVQYGVSAIG